MQGVLHFGCCGGVELAVQGDKVFAFLLFDSCFDIDTELLNLLAIATPHIAGYSADGKANGTAAAVQAVASCLGLPLTDWRPEATPELLCETALRPYDVSEDDARLRKNPELFEKLREEYPVRRDFSALFSHAHYSSCNAAELGVGSVGTAR